MYGSVCVSVCGLCCVCNYEYNTIDARYGNALLPHCYRHKEQEYHNIAIVVYSSLLYT